MVYFQVKYEMRKGPRLVLRDFIKKNLKNGEIFLFDRVFGPDSRTYHDVKEGALF